MGPRKFHYILCYVGVLSGFCRTGQYTAVPCTSGKPTCLSQVSASSLDNVYSLPPVAPLSFHRSMRGNCFSSPVLDLLTYLWPLCVHRCTFTPAFSRTARLPTADHCPVQESPFLSMMLFPLHILYLYQSCHSSVCLCIFLWST